MKPQALFISALGSAMLLSAIPAHSQTTDLEKMLTSSIKERVQMPLLFSTRDTTFALSLPDDEPAEVYLHVTVDRKGRVKEKLTRVNANHLGAYVAPTFADATKELRASRKNSPASTQITSEPMWPRHLPTPRKNSAFRTKQCLLSQGKTPL